MARKCKQDRRSMYKLPFLLAAASQEGRQGQLRMETTTPPSVVQRRPFPVSSSVVKHYARQLRRAGSAADRESCVA